MTDDGTRSPPPGRRAGADRTVQVSLRLPAKWISQLRTRALAASANEQSTITPQEIVRRILGSALGQDTPKE